MSKVPLLRESDLSDEYRYLLSEDAMGEIHLLQAMANNPPLLQSYMRYGSALWRDCGLESRSVELAILAVARELDARYEWHQHVEIAREQGITDGEILAISAADLGRFSEDERRIMTYAQAVARGDVPERILDDICDRFDDSTVVGITLLATHYVATARFLDALALPVEGSFVGWELEREE